MNNNIDSCCINFSNNLFISSFLVSLVLAQDLNEDDQNLLGSYLQMVGQNLTSIAYFTEYCQSKKDVES